MTGAQIGAILGAATSTPTARPPFPPTAVPSPTPAPPPAAPIFGTQMQSIAAEQGLDLVEQAGAHWIRFLTLEWDRIEPVRTDPPTYHWETVDEASLLAAAQRGLEVIAQVQFTPEWAQAVPGSFCGPVDEKALPAMAQFVQAAVERYSAPPYQVRYWELGNEPDVAPQQVRPREAFGCWADLADPYHGGRAYAHMLSTVYPAIKQADPAAWVLLGGLLLDRPEGGPDNNPRFLEGILEGGGGPYFDLVSFHAYAYFDPATGRTGSPKWPGAPTVLPAKVAFIRAVLERYGLGDKGLMNTESALLCAESTPECQDAQAAYVTRSYAEALGLGLEAQVYYAWINEGWRYTGLVLPDLTPKPAYRAFYRSAAWLAELGLIGPVSGYEPGIDGYRFGLPGAGWTLDVVWADGDVPLPLFLSPDVLAYDHYGQPLRSPRVAVGHRPVYVARFAPAPPAAAGRPRPH